MSDRASECRWQYRFIVLDLLLQIAHKVGVDKAVIAGILGRIKKMKEDLETRGSQY